MSTAATTESHRGSIGSDWRRAWLVVLAATIGYGSGGAVLQLTNGLFIVPMREDLGWSTTAVTIAPIVTLVWGLCSPLAGFLVDRIGGRQTALIGTLGVGLCLILFAAVPITRTTLYSIAAAIGFFSALTSTPPYSRVVATWFPSGVGLPIGITLSGSALVALFSLPLVGWAISSWGWRAGYLVNAGITLLIGLPIILLACRERVGDMSAESVRHTAVQKTGVSVAQALRRPVFWWYFSSFSLGCIPLGGFLSHLQPLLREQGFAISSAVQLGMIFAVSVTFGRVLGGYLLDRVWPFAVGATFLFLAAAGAFAAGHVNEASPFIICAAIVWLIGMGQGAEADFIAFFTLRSFGMRSFGTIVGLTALLATASVAVGAYSYSRLFDVYDNYLYACYLGAACWAVSALFLLLAGLAEHRSDPARMNGTTTEAKA